MVKKCVSGKAAEGLAEKRLGMPLQGRCDDVQ